MNTQLSVIDNGLLELKNNLLGLNKTENEIKELFSSIHNIVYPTILDNNKYYELKNKILQQGIKLKEYNINSNYLSIGFETSNDLFKFLEIIFINEIISLPICLRASNKSELYNWQITTVFMPLDETLSYYTKETFTKIIHMEVHAFAKIPLLDYEFILNKFMNA
jgi:hypothetical protein